MSRADRVCPTLPTWMLRMIVTFPSWRDWWAVAWLEIWKREVEDVVAMTADEENGPWPCTKPKEFH